MIIVDFGQGNELEISIRIESLSPKENILEVQKSEFVCPDIIVEKLLRRH